MPDDELEHDLAELDQEEAEALRDASDESTRARIRKVYFDKRDLRLCINAARTWTDPPSSSVSGEKSTSSSYSCSPSEPFHFPEIPLPKEPSMPDLSFLKESQQKLPEIRLVQEQSTNFPFHIPEALLPKEPSMPDLSFLKESQQKFPDIKLAQEPSINFPLLPLEPQQRFLKIPPPLFPDPEKYRWRPEIAENIYTQESWEGVGLKTHYFKLDQETRELKEIDFDEAYPNPEEMNNMGG